MRCSGCQLERPTRFGSFRSNIGAVFARIERRSDGFFCERCYRDTYWRHQGVNLALGWWGVHSFFVTLALLPANAFAYARGRRRVRLEEHVPRDSDDAERAAAAGLRAARDAMHLGAGLVAALGALVCVAVALSLPPPGSRDAGSGRTVLFVVAAVTGLLAAWFLGQVLLPRKRRPAPGSPRRD